MSAGFYAQLPPLTAFAAITDPRSFTRLPDDWLVVITDVRGSTRAIAEGRYKEVNMIGAASIVALLNAARPVEIPFVFGGDGATLAVPRELEGVARAVLGGLQALARQSFGLELRAGLVPAAELAALGHPASVARLAISELYQQAAFSGGLSVAEGLIKDPARGAAYLVPPAADADGLDLGGLECRWQDIPSRHGETVSLLVTPAPGPPEAMAATLREVLAELAAVYGDDGAASPLTRGDRKSVV